jgi:UDP-N-acetyl-2-amino-2-deoxyglucuronate dehydrogenase
LKKPYFALIGSSGFVAPRHLRAIHANNGMLLAALDPHDAAGGLDAYFPNAAFFTEFERFDRHLEKLKRNGNQPDYLSVCSPNYLHDAHVRYGLRYGADVICEKPLVLNPHNVEALQDLEKDTGRSVFNILQLRLHPNIIALKKQVEQSPEDKVFDIDLSYITPRGKWYHASWKGDPSKSGGVITNIGIHLFDMLLWVFGPAKNIENHLLTHGRAAGHLRLERARVRWFLSIEAETLPATSGEPKPYRSMLVNDRQIDFSDGFGDLHTLSYQHILAGKGWRIADAAPGIALSHQLRNTPSVLNPDTAHPLAFLPPLPHPFGKG